MLRVCGQHVTPDVNCTQLAPSTLTIPTSSNTQYFALHEQRQAAKHKKINNYDDYNVTTNPTHANKVDCKMTHTD